MGGASFHTVELFHGLLGDWALAREIFDGSGKVGRARGTLSVVSCGEGAWATESARLLWTGREFEARARHYWRLEGDALAVADAPDAVTRWSFDLTQSRTPDGARTAHQCAADLYEGRLIIDVGSFEIAWTVRGPRKAYRSQTRFLRFDLRDAPSQG